MGTASCQPPRISPTSAKPSPVNPWICPIPQRCGGGDQSLAHPLSHRESGPLRGELARDANLLSRLGAGSAPAADAAASRLGADITLWVLVGAGRSKVRMAVSWQRCYRRQNVVVRCCRARVARGSAAPPHSLLHGGGLLPRVSTRRCGAAAELSTRQHGAAAQSWRQHGPAVVLTRQRGPAAIGKGGFPVAPCHTKNLRQCACEDPARGGDGAAMNAQSRYYMGYCGSLAGLQHAGCGRYAWHPTPAPAPSA